MGYAVTLARSTYAIPSDRLDAAWAAIQASGIHSASTFAPNTTSTDKVAEWLEAAGFEMEEDENGNLLVNAFPTRKSHDEEHRLRVLAPYAEEGSVAEWIGEDDYRWRGLVRDGALVEQEAVVTWEE